MTAQRPLIVNRWLRKPHHSFTLAILLGLLSCQWFTSSGEDLKPDEDRYVWRTTGHTNAGVPWFDQSTVFYLGFEHELTAVDKMTGSVRWSVRLPVNHPRTVGFGGTVIGERLYVGDKDLFAVNARTGEIAWRCSPPEGVDVGRWFPVLWNGVVIVGSSNGWLFAVDTATGGIKWNRRLSNVGEFLVYPAPVVDGVVYVTTVDFASSANNEPLGGVAAIEAQTGNVLWSREIPHHVAPDGPTATVAPVVAEGIVVAGSRDGPVYGFDRLTGEQRWKMEPFPFPHVTDPALIRDTHWLATCGSIVFIGSTSTHVAAINPRTGAEIWRTPRSTATADTVWCDGRSVLVMRPLGGIEVLDALTGTSRWELRFPRRDFFFGSATDARHVYVGGRDGVYALRYD